MEKNHTHVINRPRSGRLMVNRPLAGRYRVIMLAYLMIIHYLTCMQSDDNDDCMAIGLVVISTISCYHKKEIL